MRAGCEVKHYDSTEEGRKAWKARMAARMPVRKQIESLIEEGGGNYRYLSEKVMEKIGLMLWFNRAISDDFLVIGGTYFRHLAWRAEAKVAQAWMTEEWKRNKSVELSWRHADDIT